MATPMSNVFHEVAAERNYQDSKWGHGSDDTLNTPWMWVAYITAYSTKWMKGTFTPLSKEIADDFRTKMIKTAAIAIAAVESLDRQREVNNKAFFE